MSNYDGKTAKFIFHDGDEPTVTIMPYDGGVCSVSLEDIEEFLKFKDIDRNAEIHEYFCAAVANITQKVPMKRIQLPEISKWEGE